MVFNIGDNPHGRNLSFSGQTPNNAAALSSQQAFQNFFQANGIQFGNKADPLNGNDAFVANPLIYDPQAHAAEINNQKTTNPFDQVPSLSTLNKRQNGNQQIGLLALEVADDEHAAKVTSIAEHTGVADLVSKDFIPVNDKNYPVSFAGLQDMVDDAYVDTLDAAGSALLEPLFDPNNNQRVISMSFGESTATLASKLAGRLKSNGAAKDMFFQGMGLTNTSTDEEIDTALFNFVNDRLANSNKINQAVQDYRLASQLAADNGIIGVMAVENYHDYGQPDVSNNPELARRQDTAFVSDYVIQVGGYDDNNTPTDFSDDRGFTAAKPQNDPNQPFISADAAGFGVTPADPLQQGTSFATPQVAGTIQEMLTDDPTLGLDDVKRLLLGTSRTVPTQNGPVKALNEEAAIKAVKDNL